MSEYFHPNSQPRLSNCAILGLGSRNSNNNVFVVYNYRAQFYYYYYQDHLFKTGMFVSIKNLSHLRLHALYVYSYYKSEWWWWRWHLRCSCSMLVIHFMFCFKRWFYVSFKQSLWIGLYLLLEFNLLSRNYIFYLVTKHIWYFCTHTCSFGVILIK